MTKSEKTSPKSEDGNDAENDIQPILIKKYPNRRLYNTSTSSYIVLDDIVELVKADTSFVIQEKKTGEDITRHILNQIIFEQEVKPDSGSYHFPLEVQKQLISMYGDTYGAMIPDYLTNSMKLFISERSRMSDAVENVMGRNTQAMVEFSQNMARQNMELFKKSWEMFGGMAGVPAGREADDSAADNKPAPSGREQELEKIQDEIDALQTRLKSLK